MRRSSRQLIVAALGLALVALGAPIDSASAQQAVTVQLSAQNDSGMTGTAVLTPMGAQTRVVLTLTNAPGPHPAHIHTGTCANLNPVPAYPLTAMANGTSETTVNVALSALQASTYAINVHKSPQEAAVYTACGNIPALASTTAAPSTASASGSAAAPAAQPARAPAQLPRTGEAAFGLYGLAALGGLLLLGGLTLLVRRRAI